jgi:hypothetical protein
MCPFFGDTGDSGDFGGLLVLLKFSITAPLLHPFLILKNFPFSTLLPKILPPPIQPIRKIVDNFFRIINIMLIILFIFVPRTMNDEL